MKRKIKNNTLLYPIWKVILFDELEFYVLGENKKHAVVNILLDEAITIDDINSIIPLSNDEAKNILIDTDGGFDSFDSLFNEALWVQQDKDMHFIVACCYDVVANLNLIHNP